MHRKYHPASHAVITAISHRSAITNGKSFNAGCGAFFNIHASHSSITNTCSGIRMLSDNMRLVLCTCRDESQILGYYDTCLNRISISILVLIYTLRHFHRIVLVGAIDRSLNPFLCGLRGSAIVRIIAIHSINIPLISVCRCGRQRERRRC